MGLLRRGSLLQRASAGWLGEGIVIQQQQQQQRWISLKDIAAAFGEMAAAEAPAGPLPHSANTAPRLENVDRKGRPSFASLRQQPPPQAPPRFSSQQRTTPSGPSVPAGQASSARNAAARPHNARAPSSILTLSPGHAQYLASLPERGLLAEMEKSHRRVHYGFIVQSLMELSHRLAQHERASALGIGDAGAARVSRKDANSPAAAAAAAVTTGEEVNTWIGTWPLASSTADHLLEAALRCLTKMNLAQLEPEITVAAQAVVDKALPEAKQQPQQAANALLFYAESGQSLTRTLGNQLLTWLATRVALFDAVTSVTFLHLLVQQRVFFADDVLATLVDNVLARNQTHSRCGTQGSPTVSGEPLTLRDFALFFDAAARCETTIHFAAARWKAARQQLAARRRAHRQRCEALSAQGVYFMDDDAVPSYSSTTATSGAPAARTANPHAAPDTSHPLCNEAVYDAMITRLIDHVTLRRKALVLSEEKRETRPTVEDAGVLFPVSQGPAASSLSHDSGDRRRTSALSAGGVWSELDTVSFFFLTRALGKLEYFRQDLVRSLLPGMAQYLQRHPEQFLGLVLLVGRRENSAADPLLLHVLLKTLTERLEKRSAALVKPASPSLASATQLAAAADGDDELEDILHDDRPPPGAVDVNEEDEDGDAPPLLSEDAHARAVAGVTAKAGERLAAVPGGRGTASTRHGHAFAVSLIDIFTLAKFLECLCHQYTLVTTQLLSGETVATDGGGDPGRPSSGGDGTSEAGESGQIALTPQRMREDMLRLYELLLDDGHRGVPSVSSLLRLSPAVLELTLSQILTTNLLLLSSAASSSSASHPSRLSCEADTDDKVPTGEAGGCGAAKRLRHHPLLLELAYVWTQHVARSRLVIGDHGGPRSHKEGKSLSTQILASLVETKVLERIVVVQRRRRPEGHLRHRKRTQNPLATEEASGRGPRYDSQGRSHKDADPHLNEGGATARVACYVMPLPLLQACAPRVLAAIQNSLSEQDGQRGKERGGDHDSSSLSSPATMLAEDSADANRSKRQKLLLAKHFARFSTAVGAREV